MLGVRIMHGAVATAGIIVGSAAVVSHTGRIEQETGDECPILTNDEGGVEAPISLIEIVAPDQEAPHIGCHGVVLQVVHSRHRGG